jgi:hypothetical protein
VARVVIVKLPLPTGVHLLYVTVTLAATGLPASSRTVPASVRPCAAVPAHSTVPALSLLRGPLPAHLSVTVAACAPALAASASASAATAAVPVRRVAFMLVQPLSAVIVRNAA